MNIKAFVYLSALSLAACGGGSQAMPAAPIPTAAPMPTAAPLALRRIAGAPLNATAAQLDIARRSAQAHTESQGVENGLPILVESSGMVSFWAGSITSWVTSTQSTADIAETGLSVVPSGALAFNNPAPQPLSCLGQISAVCAVHPTAWQWGTASTNGKPVGKQTVTVAFSDGTTGATHDYVYDGWNLPCDGGWAYANGVPVATTTQGASDVYADCVGGNIIFPRGASVLAQPTQDQFGRAETIMPTLTAQPAITAPLTTLALSAITVGEVIAINTQDGGQAKVLFTDSPGIAINAASGMSLHSQADGTFAF